MEQEKQVIKLCGAFSQKNILKSFQTFLQLWLSGIWLSFKDYRLYLQTISESEQIVELLNSPTVVNRSSIFLPVAVDTSIKMRPLFSA